jgi:RHS repeat-associated protein
MYITGTSIVKTITLNKTLYASPYMVVNDQEYTKHYYIEGERICSKIGSGFGSPLEPPPLDYNPSGDKGVPFPTQLWNLVIRGIQCTGGNTKNIYITPNFSVADTVIINRERENHQYFYHPDHLGSSSFITNRAGNAIEHLQYLPYGETFVSQRSGNYDTPYKFSGKEKDDETQYSYFGARYYDSDLSIWLSVDPMADQNFGISPYNYCHNNPVIIIDPDGMNDGWVQTSDGIYWDKNINSQDDFNKSGITGKYLGQTGFGKDANSNSNIFYSGSGEKQVLLSAVEVVGSRTDIAPIESNSGSNTVDIFSHPSDNLKDDPLQYGIKELLASTEDFLFGWAKQAGQNLNVATDNSNSTNDRVNAGVNAAILIGFGLPSEGEFSYKPPKNWKNPNILPKGPKGGYVDVLENIWTQAKGSNIQGERHWDVQLSKKGQQRYNTTKSHINVNSKGQICH